MAAQVEGPTRADERRHLPGNSPSWCESWSLELIAPEHGLGAVFELVISASGRIASFHASLVRAGQSLVTLSELEADVPAPPGLELRAPGLWVEIGIQTALEHVTVDVEAFAVELDDPDEVFGRAYGDRVAFGTELEWESAEAPAATRDGYEIPCVVHGEVLLADQIIDIDGWGWRSHRWGSSAADHSGFRGRRADGHWSSEVPADEFFELGRAPLAALTPDHPGVEQRLLANAAGDAGWQRWVLG